MNMIRALLKGTLLLLVLLTVQPNIYVSADEFYPTSEELIIEEQSMDNSIEILQDLQNSDNEFESLSVANYEQANEEITYTVTVVNGLGSGEYSVGSIVTIKADDPPHGMVFAGWTVVTTRGEVILVEDNLTATFTMPDGGVKLVAEYQTPPTVYHTVKVNDGTGSGPYEEGSIVTITTSEDYSFSEYPREFSGWIINSGDVILEDETNITTSFAMPAGDVEITSVWDMYYPLSVINGSGSGNYLEGDIITIIADEPPTGFIFQGWRVRNEVGYLEYVDEEAIWTLSMPATSVYIEPVFERAPHFKAVGRGTELDPFLISTQEDLILFSKTINDQELNNIYSDKHYKLTSNIDISNIENWIPIGKSSDFSFRGSFDGSNYTISGMKIYEVVTNDMEYGRQEFGLFGRVGGNIRNLNLINANIDITFTIPSSPEHLWHLRDYVGGIVGFSYGLLDDLSFSGNINIRSNKHVAVGGIAGSISNKLANGTSYGHISINANVPPGFYNPSIGGVAGMNSGTIEKSENHTVITGESGDMNIGGISGASYSNMNNVVNYGDISGYAGSVGGVVGHQFSGDNTAVVNNAVNAGSVSIISTIEGSWSVSGGIIGSASKSSTYGEIQLNVLTNVGKITSSSIAGGIIGRLFEGAILTNAYNRGDVSGVDSGGIVGDGNKVSISQVFNMGTVSGTETIGGIAGYLSSSSVFDSYNYGFINSSITVNPMRMGGIIGAGDYSLNTSNLYYLDSISQAIGSSVSIAATKLTQKQMHYSEFFSAFDFQNTWMLPEGNYHPPVLRALYVPLESMDFNRDIMISGQIKQVLLPNPIYATVIYGDFISTDETVLTVSSNGEITAKKPGISYVTGTPYGLNTPLFFKIEVLQGVENIIVPSKVSLLVGEERLVIPEVLPTNSQNQELDWVSNDKSIATVDEYGRISGLSPGQTEITVMALDGSTTHSVILVEVVQPATGFDIIQAELKLFVGDSEILNYEIFPQDVSNRNIIWTSNDERIAYVDQDNILIAVGTGEVLITGETEDGGFADALYVSVYNEIEDITITNKVDGIALGSSLQLGVEIYPDSTIQQDMIWHSSNYEIASIDTNGLLTGVKEGEVLITVRSQDGKHSDFHFFTVGPPISDIIISGPREVMLGTEAIFAAELEPDDAVNKNVKWSVIPISGNGAIDTHGSFVGDAVGDVIIRVDATDGSDIYAEYFVNVSPAAVKLVSIEIESLPNKMEYIVGQTLNLEGLVIIGTYSDGTREIVPVAIDDISGYNSTMPDSNQELTISIDGLECIFVVQIYEETKSIITYYTDGGTQVPTEYSTIGSKIIEPPVPYKEDHTFAGWYYNDVEWDFNRIIDSEYIHLYAKWIEKGKIDTIWTDSYNTMYLDFSLDKNVSGYEIHRSNSIDSVVEVIKTSPGFRYMDTNLLNGHKYGYKVRLYVETINGTIYGEFSEIVEEFTPPSRPSKPTVSYNVDYISLEWDYIPEATNYEIFRSSTINEEYLFIGSSEEPKYTDSDITYGNTYKYKVRVYVGDESHNRVGDLSDYVSILVPSLSINYITSNQNTKVYVESENSKITWESHATGKDLIYYWRVYKDGVEIYSDRSYSVENNPFSYTPTEPGTYRARSYVRDYTWSNMVSLMSESIVVEQSPPPKIESVTSSVSEPVYAGDEITWESHATGKGLIYYWRVYKDGVEIYSDRSYSAGNNPFRYTPTEPGTYTVRSYVRDYTWSNMVSLMSESIVVEQIPPPKIESVTSSVSGSVYAGDEITWESHATGKDLIYYWRVYKDGVEIYSDRSYSAENNPFSYTPAEPGTYRARSYVRDYTWSNMVSLMSESIVVEQTPPPKIESVTSSASGPVYAGDEITWESHATGKDLIYYWRVYKDGVEIYSDRSYSAENNLFSYTPAEPGTYKARSYVRDYAWSNMVSLMSESIVVEQTPPPKIESVTSSASGPVYAGDEITWESHATGKDLIYYWRVYKDGVEIYSDRSYSAENNPFSYTPAELGTYTVRSYVRDYSWSNMVSLMSESIVVEEIPPPKIESVTSSASGPVYAGDEITWESHATGKNLIYYWRVYKDGVEIYSDRRYSAENNPFRYTPTEQGTYTVRSYVRDYSWSNMVSLLSDGITVH